MIPANQSPYSAVDWIPTRITSLDTILGGGFPTKRLSEVFGPYSVGKTSLALLVIKSAQEAGYKTVWADQEWTWDTNYAEHLGVDVHKLMLVQNRHAEDSLDELEKFFSDNKNSVVVLDAIGSLLPRQEDEKGVGEKSIGAQASLIAKFCRKVVPLLAINNHALIVLNHQFTDIMTGALKSSGGAKLEYHKSLSVSLKRQYGKTAKRNTDGKIFEVVVEAEIRKNKLAGTLGSKCSLYMEPGNGFLVQADLFQELVNAGMIHKEGRTHFLGETKLGFEKQAKAYVKEHVEELREALNHRQV